MDRSNYRAAAGSVARLFAQSAPGAWHARGAAEIRFAALAVAAALVSATPDVACAHADLGQVRSRLATLGVPFVPNAGQWDARAAFAARTLAGTLFVTTEGKLVYSLPATAPASAGDGGRAAGRGGSWVLTESFVSPTGSALDRRPVGARTGGAAVTYLTGDARRHRNGIGTFERVNLGEVFDGVDVQLRATGSNVEKIFTVAPHRDPGQIRVRLDGATRLEVGATGELVAHTGNGPVAYTAPIAFQEAADGTRREVAVRYALNAATRTYGFALGDYDRTRPLVIDPLLKTAYVGGSGDERANAVVVHPHSGYVYVVGSTTSSANDLPGVASGFDPTSNGGTDAFVSRLSPDLTKLIVSTYFGGSNFDAAIAVAVHPQTGDIYVAGNTQSSDMPSGDGPTGPAQINFGGGASDGFIARFTADLKSLRNVSYIGGSGVDMVGGVAVHPITGEVFVAGDTSASPTNNFPVTAGAFQTTYGGNRDAFVTSFSANLSTRTHSTFLGGAQSDIAHALVVHPVTGDVFIVGETASGAFPGVTLSNVQSTLNGPGDAFVARMDRTLTSVIASTYLGAGGTDVAQAVTYSPLLGEIIVAGYSTQSGAGAEFPGITGTSAQPANAGGRDAFVTRLNTTLTDVRSTYLGSASDDEALGVAASGSTGEIYVVGYSGGGPFATPAFASEAYQPTHQGANDVFVARYHWGLSYRLQVTYLGTASSETGTGIAIHPASGAVVVAAFTSSSTFPGVTAGQPTSFGGLTDATVSLLSPDLTAYNTIPNAVAFAPQSSVATRIADGLFPNTNRQSNEVRLVITPTPPASVNAYFDGSAGSQFCVTDTPGCCRDYPNACAGTVTGWMSTNYYVASGEYVALRHTTPQPVGDAVTRLIVGGVATEFRTSSGDATIRCNLDADGDGKIDPLVEGLILERALAGMTGDAVFAGTGVTISWAAYRDRINAGCGFSFQ